MEFKFVVSAAPGALRTFMLNESSVRLFWDPPRLFINDFMHYILKYVYRIVC